MNRFITALVAIASLATASVARGETVIASGEYIDSDNPNEISIEYLGPDPGMRQSFEFRWSQGLTFSGTNTVYYLLNRIIPNGFNDAFDVQKACNVNDGSSDYCHLSLTESDRYKTVTISQQPIGRAFRFSISNPNIVLNPNCIDSNSCTLSLSFTSLNSVIFGDLTGTASGHFELVAFDATAVPEPSIWATMLLGFMGLGAALREQQAGKGARPSVADTFSRTRRRIIPER